MDETKAGTALMLADVIEATQKNGKTIIEFSGTVNGVGPRRVSYANAGTGWFDLNSLEPPLPDDVQQFESLRVALVELATKKGGEGR